MRARARLNEGDGKKIHAHVVVIHVANGTYTELVQPGNELDVSFRVSAMSVEFLKAHSQIDSIERVT